jgi:diaminopimelate decarboxylase
MLWSRGSIRSTSKVRKNSAILNEVAGELGMIAPAAVRVNPNVDAKTHKYISTGKSENKFGVDFEAIAGLYAHAAATLPNVKHARICKCTLVPS